MNIPLLLKVKDQILKRPERLGGGGRDFWGVILRAGISDFNLNIWPTKYIIAYRKAKSAKGRARVAARRIDAFIKSGGK